MVRHYDYDIVLLDLMLPDMEGYEVLRRMRSSRLDTPVLVMSALTRPQAKVKAFTVGADDVIAKPFDLPELHARMQAIVRRSKGYSQPTLRIGPVQLHLDSRDVTVDGQSVPLTGKEYAILAACRSGVLRHWGGDGVKWSGRAPWWRCVAELVVAAILAAPIEIWPHARRSIDGRRGATWLRSRLPGRTSASCSTPWSRVSTRHGHGRGRATGTDGSQART